MHRPSRRVSCVVFLALIFVAAPAALAEGLKPEERRERFLKLVDRPRVEPEPTISEKTETDGVVEYHFDFSSEADQRVPVIALLKQSLIDDGKRHPCAIVLHGTGGKKEGELPILRKLAAKNFVAVSIDGRFHGERGKSEDYNNAIARAFRDNGSKGHPLYYDTVWDVMRLVDLLQTRPEVDGDRIGLMGISKGGIETWLAAAADPRIAVAIPCISLQSFEWSLGHDAWQTRVGTVKAGFSAAAKSEGIDKPDAKFARRFYDRVIPEIYSTFDGPAMLPLIAPRPLLGISGDRDPINPLPGARLCEEAAKAAYAKAGAGDKFQLMVEENTPHSVNAKGEAAAIAWFVKWLKPDAE
jgi:dienelactone hydrolase